MEPRQLWNRNTVLAEAFCLSDEHVRSAQSALDETQAHRSRLLAAFAVTVGSDSAVADLLGLSEREVRVARRTVGKEDARRMADDVLASVPGEVEGEPAPHEAAGHAPPQPQAPPPPPSHAPQHLQHQSYAQQAPSYVDVHAAAAPDAQAYLSAPVSAPSMGSASAATTASVTEAPGVRESAWTSAMDLVLIDSWQSGIDLRVLADEFGLDLARLVTRIQQLSAEGRLTAAPPAASPEDRSGRHRRDATGAATGSYATTAGSYAAPGSYTATGSYTAATGTYPTSGSYGTSAGSYGTSTGSYGTASYGTSTGSYDSYTNGVSPSGWEAPSTIPEEMVASYLPPQHTWPQYMAGSSR
ncbi:hypothetical protein ACH429_09170 [Streptomyces pathocidini]|uniref:RNA polymerase sigma factor 70 region 4 type 2 domain-containing protein n=1 Tax=Streptomyces pathocidini TaxID=1650571 RepID=A0ABW7URE9_9ACTN